MTSNKKSIISGIKILLSVIFILSLINFILTGFFNKQISDKENKIILTDKSIFALKGVVENFEDGEIPEQILKRNIAKIKESRNYLNLLTEGGKYNDLLITKTISPAESSFKQVLSETVKKLDKIIEKAKKISENDISLPANKIFKPSETAFIIRKLENIKKGYAKSADSYTVKKNITNILTLILILLTAISVYSGIQKNLSKNIRFLHGKISGIINRNNLPVRENEADKEFEPVLKDISVLDGKINEISNFVNNLLRDNYDIEFNNADKNDSIRKSLLNLRDKLKENIEINKKRLEEEKKRQWFAEGQAKFNDILREAGSGIKNLSETALINMVKFLNAAQGGFFIVNDNETKPFLELISAFAYDRIKMLTKRIEFGEGLVGMCALEKNTIVVTDVPEDYMQIESGLGEAAPDNILIIPLKTEDKLLGVIEIASFYDFKKEEIEFIENVAENIAATLEAVKISHKTSELLQETRKKSEELALRDSEMSEKISELRDAQKETKRSESEMTALVSVINRVLFKMELTASGKIISVNNLFLRHLGYSLADIKNKNFTEFIKNKDKKLTEDIYKKIAEYNFTEKEITFISKENTEIKTASFFSSVINEKGEISRILMLADNISYREDLQKKNNLLKEELQAKIKIITEKEKEINGMFNKIKENSFDEKSKQRQKEILKEYETPVDKKYTLWLKDLISKK